MSRFVYLNSQFIKFKDAKIHIEDRGLQFSDSVYEVVAFYNQQLIDFEFHIKRLKYSLKELKIKYFVNKDKLEKIFNKIINLNKIRNGIVYLQITRGVQSRDHNYGNNLIANIVYSATFSWDSDATSATSTRATIIANAPTAALQTLVSTPDRHLVFFGTETTIGTTSTQDDMYIRWSDQESINATTSWAPSATNTAGTQRLADGTRIVGAIRGRDAIHVWTDTSLWVS